MGAMTEEEKPIPEGTPTKGTVSGSVPDLDITILGAAQVQDADGDDLIVFYYEATNRSDELNALWHYNVDASQEGEFLEMVYVLDDVPEISYMDLEFFPGKTLRCAAAFEYDPDDGIVGFRISPFKGDEAVLYYADPQNLSGAPKEPYSFEAGPEILTGYEDLPGKTKNISFEDVEFFTDKDGRKMMRYSYHTPNDSEEAGLYHYCDAYQDGVELRAFWDDENNLNDWENMIFVNTCQLRTKSPVIIVCTEESEDGTGPVAVNIVKLN
ncbi:MAG: DUF5067 domain-containing protein, partial [Oscillospiraceae bacterium]|nr:DUF5067 domain-containing protein [Oscillospiraceae bacterium]